MALNLKLVCDRPLCGIDLQLLCSMNLLRTILTSPWMMTPPAAKAHLPLILRLMHGEDVLFPADEGRENKPYAFTPQAMRKIRYYDFSNAPEGSVAVYPVIGTVTKYSQLCGPRGTEDLMIRMGENEEAPNIVGHLLEIDSPGGQGTNLETVARFIRNEIKKPVVAWYNGTCASAAYYMASAADEIYASEETDEAGSIGVMMTFADLRKFWESQGVNIHEIYADQSELKNLDFQKARDGEYDLIKQGLLNPYAERFINTVKEFRPNLKEEDAFKGAVYMANAAIEIGMIDGIRTFERAVDRVLELAARPIDEGDDLEEDDEFLKITNTNSMERISAILGYTLEMQDGGAFLRRDELARLERHLVVEGYEAVEASALENINTRLDGISSQLDAMSQRVDQVEVSNHETLQTLSEQSQRLDELASSPGDNPTLGPSTGDDQALSDLDKSAAEAKRNGTGIVIVK